MIFQSGYVYGSDGKITGTWSGYLGMDLANSNEYTCELSMIDQQASRRATIEQHIRELFLPGMLDDTQVRNIYNKLGEFIVEAGWEEYWKGEQQKGEQK